MLIIPGTCRAGVFWAALLVITLLSACAGDGSTPPPAPTLTPTALATPTATPPG